MKKFIQQLPKAELHIHFDGALNLDVLKTILTRNGIDLDINSIYDNVDGTNFYHLFPLFSSWLKTEEDFYDVLFCYLKKAAKQNIKHAEIFFDTQAFKPFNVSTETIVNGFYKAIQDAQARYGISSYLILCFLRQYSEQDALDALQEALPFKDNIKAIGLGGPEVGNPPSKFMKVFAQAKQYGFKLTAHAGEGTSAQDVRDALNLLHVDRIDHGVSCWDDKELVQELIQKQIPITVCPVSNKILGIYSSLKQHPIKQMLDAGLLVSINSDDPEMFKCNLNQTFEATTKALQLNKADLIAFAKNSFISSFLDEETKQKYINEIEKLS